MALLAATLGTELQAMIPADTEADGINNFATAFENYFAQSTCNGVSVTPGSLSGATTALKAAMVGISATGASKVTAGIVAFWGVVAVSAPSIWVLAPVLISAVVPPTLASITAAFQAASDANIAGEKSLIDSAQAIADAIHPHNLGGIGTVITPPGGTFPIL